MVTIKREPLSPNSGDDVNVVDDDSGFASGPTTIVTRFVALATRRLQFECMSQYIQRSAKRYADFVKQQPGRARQNS